MLNNFKLPDNCVSQSCHCYLTYRIYTLYYQECTYLRELRLTIRVDDSFIFIDKDRGKNHSVTG